MKKQIFTMLTGLLIGAVLTGGSAAVAAGIMAERSHHRVVVDGKGTWARQWDLRSFGTAMPSVCR